MLIGIMGAPGTGKGQHAHHLAAMFEAEGRSVEVLHAPVGGCPFRRDTVRGQRWMHRQRTIAEDVCAVSYDVTICEGTILDYVAQIQRRQQITLMAEVFNHGLSRMPRYQKIYWHRVKNPITSWEHAAIDEWLAQIVRAYPEYFTELVEIEMARHSRGVTDGKAVRHPSGVLL